MVAVRDTLITATAILQAENKIIISIRGKLLFELKLVTITLLKMNLQAETVVLCE